MWGLNRTLSFLVLTVALISVMLATAATAQTTADIEARDTLIFEQEALLNTYRCMFDIDTELVPGGCSNGKPARPANTPAPFAGTPTDEDITTRDNLIRSQEDLLNFYRCLFNASSENPNNTSLDLPSSAYRIFDGDDFNELFNSVRLDNLFLPDEAPEITSDSTVEERIRRIATDRGYRQRPIPADVFQLVLVEGSYHRLQPEAAQAYLLLKTAMAADGLTIRLASGYRSYSDQGWLFWKRTSPPYTDQNIFNALRWVAPPGYSKHHTGYAIDLNSPGPTDSSDFSKSPSYAWLSANNYENAKRYGWIPSYPPDARQQGPDPESWEFTFVGHQHLLTPDWANLAYPTTGCNLSTLEWATYG